MTDSKTKDDILNIYDDEEIGLLLENDEISSEEEGFMKGYLDSEEEDEDDESRREEETV